MTMRRGQLLSVAAALQVFQVLRLGAVVLGSVLLARSPVGVEAVGQFEAMLFAGAVAAFFWANGLLQGVIPQYSRLREEERPVFLFQVFALFGLFSALVCGVFWVARSALLPALTGLPFAAGWGWFLLYLWVHLATLPLEHTYALHGRARALLGWGALSFGGYVVAVALPAFAGWGLSGSLQALAALGLVRLLWCVVALRDVVRTAWRPLFWQRYVRFSMPLVLNLLVGQAIVLFDSWLVGWYYSDESIFALYRYGSRELPLALALASGLGTALTARMAAEPAAGLAEMRREGVRLFHRVFPVSMVLLVVSPWLFRTLFGPAFEPAAALFNIYLLLTISRVLLPNAIALAYGHAHALLRVGLLELLLKIVTGFLFIHLWGLPGVAWSAVLSFFGEKMALMWYVRQRLGVAVSEWLDTRWFVGYSVMLGLVWALAGR
jgi:O-antigen/teichoic acid export membrane protein